MLFVWMLFVLTQCVILTVICFPKMKMNMHLYFFKLIKVTKNSCFHSVILCLSSLHKV